MVHVSLLKNYHSLSNHHPPKKMIKKCLPPKMMSRSELFVARLSLGKKFSLLEEICLPLNLKQSTPLLGKKSHEGYVYCQAGPGNKHLPHGNKSSPLSLPCKKTSPLEAICLLKLSFKNQMLLAFLNLSFLFNIYNNINIYIYKSQ